MTLLGEQNPLIRRVFSSQIDMQKTVNFAFFITIAAFVMLFGPMDVFAADPLETLKGIFKQEASDNAFPIIIVWLLATGVVTSVLMSRWMPFIFSAIGCVIIAVAPEAADAFNSTNITPAGGW